ncbi:hypothetical protein EV687_2358 [Corticibacter populi]|nr:hypothetical protein EV687_2358 [Corticibacter populi]
MQAQKRGRPPHPAYDRSYHTTNHARKGRHERNTRMGQRRVYTGHCSATNSRGCQHPAPAIGCPQQTHPRCSTPPTTTWFGNCCTSRRGGRRAAFCCGAPDSATRARHRPLTTGSNGHCVLDVPGLQWICIGAHGRFRGKAKPGKMTHTESAPAKALDQRYNTSHRVKLQICGQSQAQSSSVSTAENRKHHQSCSSIGSLPGCGGQGIG